MDTIFVALAHEPQALAEKDPALYAEIARCARVKVSDATDFRSVSARRHACLMLS